MNCAYCGKPTLFSICRDCFGMIMLGKPPRKVEWLEYDPGPPKAEEKPYYKVVYRTPPPRWFVVRLRGSDREEIAGYEIEDHAKQVAEYLGSPPPKYLM